MDIISQNLLLMSQQNDCDRINIEKVSLFFPSMVETNPKLQMYLGNPSLETELFSYREDISSTHAFHYNYIYLSPVLIPPF